MNVIASLVTTFSVLAAMACGPSTAIQAAPAKPSTPTSVQAGPETAQGTVKGILRQVGNAPHIEVVVSGESAAFGKGDYFLIGPKAEELARQPLGPITVQGKLRKMALRFAGTSGKARIRLDVDVSEYKR